jgi:hypothetical protein
MGLLGVGLLVCLLEGSSSMCHGEQPSVGGAGPLYINEILAVNSRGLKDQQGHRDDWIEIYNASDRAVNLAGMYLTDDLSRPAKWQFPMDSAAQATVPPKGYLLVWADGDTAAAGLHAAFSLSGEGEEVGLFDLNGRLLDAIAFGPQTTDVSFGRTSDGGADLGYFGLPTPGARNNTAYLGEVQDPPFSHSRGFYDRAVPLTIVCPTPGARILYTTDGTDPEHPMIGPSTARVYTAPLAIAARQTTCVRAVAVLDGWKSSRLIAHTYVLNAGAAAKSLPLISLVGDPGQTFYEPNGVAAIVGGS